MNTLNEFGKTQFQYRENEDTEILFASLCLLKTKVVNRIVSCCRKSHPMIKNVGFYYFDSW